MSALLGSLGHQNHGIFSRADALDSGESDGALRLARRDGSIVRLRRGMYVAAERYEACDDSGKHLLHARAALAAQHGEVALAGASAAALHGYALYGHDLSVVHLLRLDTGASRRSARASHHRVLPAVAPNEVGSYGGVLAVSPARSVWEVACSSSLESGVVTADSALHHDRHLRTALEELTERFAYVAGSRTARTAVRLADHRSETPGESVTRVQFFRYDIPTPTLQYEVVSESGLSIGFSDFYWDEFRHLGEFDGFVKYQKLLRPGESPSTCVFREKKREDLMRAGLRGMSRFVWPMVMPQQTPRSMIELRGALDQSYRLYVRGRVIIAT